MTLTRKTYTKNHRDLLSTENISRVPLFANTFNYVSLFLFFIFLFYLPTSPVIIIVIFINLFNLYFIDGSTTNRCLVIFQHRGEILRTFSFKEFSKKYWLNFELYLRNIKFGVNLLLGKNHLFKKICIEIFYGSLFLNFHLLRRLSMFGALKKINK